MLGRVTAALGGAAAAAAAWGWYEAGWVRMRSIDVELSRLPEELDGLRIAHLSDFHLGVPSRGVAAVERAVAWVEERRPDLILLTGDLLTHPRGEPRLRTLLPRLGQPSYAVLGNHDFGDARDPLAAPSRLDDLSPVRLLRDESVVVEIRGRTVQVVGIDPTSYRSRRATPGRHVLEHVDLRILLCHFPKVFEAPGARAYDLVLAGHLHDGQIAIPYGFGKLRIAHFDWRYTRGLYRRGGSVLHVSPGLGTTFVPFRFFARPEATELVLRRHS